MNRIVTGTQYNSQTLLNGSAPWGTAPGGTFHIGPNNLANTDTIQYQIDPMNVAALGLTTTNVSTQAGANTAITQSDVALTSINALRADLGALTNRLEHALSNQENQEQNMQAAESVIRDADFAYETTLFTRNQILSQSSTAMLSQANMLPQNVLSLLQG